MELGGIGFERSASGSFTLGTDGDDREADVGAAKDAVGLFVVVL